MSSSFLGIDVVDGTLTGADISDNTVGVNDIGSQQVASDEVLNDSLLQSDIRSGAVTSDEVLDNSLIGADINESSLNLPQTPTTTNFTPGSASLPSNSTLTQVASKSLPAGAYSITATVHGDVNTFFEGDHIITLYCELRNGTGFPSAAGRTAARYSMATPSRGRSRSSAERRFRAAAAPSACGADPQANEFVEGQMMITRIDGFF